MARTSEIIERATLHLHIRRDFHLDFTIVDNARHFADEAARHHDRVASADILDHIGMRAGALLLRPHDQEIHDDENEREGRNLHQNIGPADSRGTRRLRKSRSDEQWGYSLIGPLEAPLQMGADYSSRSAESNAGAAAKSPVRMTKRPCRAAASWTQCRLPAKAQRTRDQAMTIKENAGLSGRALPPTADGMERQLARIAELLERLVPKAKKPLDFASADAFVWHADQATLQPVAKVNRIEMTLLRGIDRVRDILVDNTERFSKGLPANNALLWGARGMGKSSLVKATHADINRRHAGSPGFRPLKLIEIHREDIESLPHLMGLLRDSAFHFLVFCDDLSFDADDTSYKSLKAVLEGGIEGRPRNVLFYATSNRRHLLPRDMMDNERSTAINPGEAVEEKVSLSDRFGLWLGFHKCSQDEYLAMVHGYAEHFGLDEDKEKITRSARMGDDARRAIRPHGLAIYSGSGGTDGQDDGVRTKGSTQGRDYSFSSFAWTSAFTPRFQE